ncbi:MAG: protein kinase domain-containing protein [Thermoguttaceae bacterium]
MSTDPTLPQADSQRRRSLELSLPRGRPPAEVPGYDLERPLGQGAYGEVWVGTEKNTSRRVAVKFYSHRGGLDWSLLTREVEKLAFLFADRYVVQLIGVGWDADPPYYVMEYLEHGSLADRLRNGPLPVAEAVELFREVAVGLVHAHGKGVLHCDLKPANVLLDQDGKPRLADFGQSRLSHEQVPTLGTLFYMAPEQADLKAVPDARWDVYALGALLYCMLTGNPPHRTNKEVELLERTADLEERLAIYRRMIRQAPPPAEHRRLAQVDRALAEIIDRCLAPDPARRYPNVQAVLDALDARQARRAFRPMMVLGAVGPASLLLVVSVFAWQGFSIALRRSEQALTKRALENNRLTALYVAGIASKELQRRCEAVEQVAASEPLRKAIAQTVARPPLAPLLEALSDPTRSEAELAPLREQFRQHPDRQRFQKEFEALIPPWMRPPHQEGAEQADEVASWFFCDAHGISTARTPESKTIGRNYAWRSFFHGGDRDLEPTWRPEAPPQRRTTQLSAVFRSQASNHWIVAVSTPVWDPEPTGPGSSGKFLGVVALTVRVNRFVNLKGDENQFAVLVDLRPGDHTGMILQHPLYDRLLQTHNLLPDRLQRYRLAPEDLPLRDQTKRDYRDPLAADPEGGAYDRHWLAWMEPVSVRDGDQGWGVIVQEAYQSAIGQTLAELRSKLIGYGLAAVAMVVLVLVSLWSLAFRLLSEAAPWKAGALVGGATERPRPAPSPHVPTETYPAQSAQDQRQPGSP